MFYRVDYIIALFLAGLIVGALLSRPTSRIEPSRLARRYFILFAAVIAVRVLVFVCLALRLNGSTFGMIFAGTGDATNFLFGVIFGLATLRSDRRELLCNPAIFSVLCLSAGIGYVINGYLNASIGTNSMSQFFVQSGYSAQFQMFIATAELLGGIGLIIRWTALPAIAGLSIDMFGAIYTHIHNGDPLNDSTGAIAALIRFAAIVAIWAWPGPGSNEVHAQTACGRRNRCRVVRLRRRRGRHAGASRTKSCGYSSNENAHVLK